jgi:hypothetical protein
MIPNFLIFVPLSAGVRFAQDPEATQLLPARPDASRAVQHVAPCFDDDGRRGEAGDDPVAR